MSSVLTLVDLETAGIPKDSKETLTFARGLADANGWELVAACIGSPPGPACDELRAHGVVRVHALVDDHLDVDAAPAAVGEALAQLQSLIASRAVVGSGTERASEVMAHVGARLEAPLASNCTEISAAADGGWEVTRLRWGGVLLEDAYLGADIALVTAAAHQTTAHPAATPGEADVVPFSPNLEDPALHLTRVAERASRGGGLSLATAPVVVSGGRGVGSAEGFAALEELAELLGGAVGCSRVATNNGWRSHNDQVGQTGTRVAPDLYLACGISGATQHWVGCMGSKRILAINTDAQAPMVTRAHYAVLGDLHELLPALVAEVQARRVVV